MKTPRIISMLSLATLLPCAPAIAAETAPAVSWHAASLPQALSYTLLFAFVGIAAAILGYWLFDKCTPGDLHKEVIANKNIAAAIIGGAVIIGVCIIVAAAIMG